MKNGYSRKHCGSGVVFDDVYCGPIERTRGVRRHALPKGVRHLANQSGQAVVEYILVLVVVVGVILGGLYQLNGAFKVWADSYFGDYLACLLETGELPALGGGDGTGGECNRQYKPFSLKDGRTTEGQDITANGGKDNEADSSNNEDKDEAESSGSNTYSGGGGKGSVNGEGRLGPSSRIRVNRRAGLSGSEGDNESHNQTGSGAVTDLSGYETGKAIRIPVRDMEPITGAARRKKDQERREATHIPVKAEESKEKQRAQAIKVERRMASAIKEADTEGLSFGYFLRYLLIAAIVIAIIFFIGGQILQVSKSMD